MVKNKRTLILAIVGALLCSEAMAQNFSFGSQAVGEIEAMSPLPADGFNVLQVNGRLIIVSKDGHYAVKGGRIFDAWHGLEVKTMADLEKSKRIPKKFRELPFEQMGTVSFGNKSGPEILVFLDPTFSKGKPIITQLVGLSKTHLIRILPVPASDSKAVETQQMICLKPIEQLKYLKGDAVKLPDAKGCDKGPMMRNVVSAMAMKVKTLPRVIAPNGAMKAGEFDIQAFVATNKK